MTDVGNTGVTLTVVKGCIVATLHANLHDTAFEQIGEATLARVTSASAMAVIFDVSAVRLLDSHEFGQLRRMADMLRLLGCRTVLVGLSAGVVAYLVAQDVDISGIEVERDLEEALERLIPGKLGGAR